MSELKWYGIKTVDKGKTVHLEAEVIKPHHSVALQSVWTNTYRRFSENYQKLQIYSEKIKLESTLNSDSNQGDMIEVSITDIKIIQYAESKDLIKITLETSIHSKYIPHKMKNAEFFKDIIWFCLQISDFNDFQSVIHSLHDNYPLKYKISQMTSELYDELISEHSKHHLGNENISENINGEKSLNDSDNTKLLDKFVDIKLTSSPNNKEISATDSSKIPIEATQVILKRRKLKRIQEISSVIVAKRSRTALRSNIKLLYSPSPTQSIEITTSDLRCLIPKKYLNDNIINLYLTYLYNEELTETQKEVTYFFNVFFNTKLIGTAAQQKIDTAETRHARVAKWTKNVDIFSKDFIVIPVIEDEHWFLVIVCFPWMAGMVNYSKLFHMQNNKEIEIPINNTEFATKIRRDKSTDIENKQMVTPMPCILIFDSLDFKNRSGKVNIIRDYLKSEWDLRRKPIDGPLIFDKTTCRGYSPIVPKQHNGTDCGLFLLQYVESFFKNPLKSYNREVFRHKLSNWFTCELIDKKRELMSRVILEKTKEIILEETNDDEDSVNDINIL